MSYLHNYQALPIPYTLEVIALCWKAAEQELQKEIKTYYPNANEEFITRMFRGRFAFQLCEASRHELIANAFLADLQYGFPELAGSASLAQIATGLIAEATLHGRKSEAITGGDFGFMIIRPQVAYDPYYTISNYRRGLLCQAKLKNEEKTWGTFTRNQKKVLPDRLAYLGLLLYDYEDELRRNLCQFK